MKLRPKITFCLHELILPVLPHHWNQSRTLHHHGPTSSITWILSFSISNMCYKVKRASTNTLSYFKSLSKTQMNAVTHSNSSYCFSPYKVLLRTHWLNPEAFTGMPQKWPTVLFSSCAFKCNSVHSRRVMVRQSTAAPLSILCRYLNDDSGL